LRYGALLATWDEYHRFVHKLQPNRHASSGYLKFTRLSGWAALMIVIFNPTAGRRRARLLWRVLDTLSANGVRVQLAETRYAGHAAALARAAAADGVRLIVAAGGDGTIAEVAGGINGSGAALGVIPLGTANVLAREMALPFAVPAIAAALAFGRTRTLWPGVATGAAGDRLFVQMLGVGLDAQVVHRLPLGLKRAFGRNAYVAQTLREMVRYRYRPIRIRIDGKVAEAGSVVISKGTLYAGQYLLAPGARPGEPGFTVALFGRSGPGAVLMYGAALTMNLLPRAPGMTLLRAREVEICEGESVLAQADGDPAGQAPMTVRDAARPIEVVVA
jgi:YegS/Rv2252/BmrU family lipid kinase